MIDKEEHITHFSVGNSVHSEFSFIPCARYTWDESFHNKYDGDKFFLENSYDLVSRHNTTSNTQEVTCPKCKQTWEYIEACIAKANKQGDVK